ILSRCNWTVPDTRRLPSPSLVDASRRAGRNCVVVFFFQAEDGIRDPLVTGVQTCALPICPSSLTVTAALSRDSQSPPQTLTLIASDDDFLVPTGSVRGEYVADIEFLSGSGSITLSGYVDTTNTPFGSQILIGTTTEGSVPFVAWPVPFTLGGPYALTLLAVVTLQPDSSVPFTHRLPGH